jgi:hypothetical protein
MRVAIFAADTFDFMPPRPTPLVLPPAMVSNASSIQAGDVGENDEQIALHLAGDQRRQSVILANLHTLHGHRIVLVDHRDHVVQTEQRQQRVANMQVALAVVDVVAREEQLPDDAPMRRKERRVA